jgi:glutamate synthase (NADPH/NADH) small chain
MGDPRGFIKVKREGFGYRPVAERVRDYNEVAVMHTEAQQKEQASRCMDCGTPFCNWGCPLGNYIPEWNDSVFKGRWQDAFTLLNETSTMPEVTGRVCPSPCEYACVLGIGDAPVTVRDNELAIIEKAWKEGYIKPNPPAVRSGKKVAVVGAGPSGLAAAALVNKQGHNVTVFEKADRIGGFMRYGIPDFKLAKSVLDRRIKLWQEEGIVFRTGVNVGVDLDVEKLKKEFDAVIITIGCRVARDMKIKGRELKGIYQAVDYLEQSNRNVAGDRIQGDFIDAKDKKVLVIGGGDTGSDCVGTANRQGAKSVVQIEILPQPSKDRPADQPWPKYPFVFKTSSSHEEGVERQWCITTKEFAGANGAVNKVRTARVDWCTKPGERPSMSECAGSDFEIEADLVFLSMGFTNPVKEGLLDKLGVKLDDRGNVIRDAVTGATSISGIFAAGDVSRGPSLIVWAFTEGRKAALGVDQFLRKK